MVLGLDDVQRLVTVLVHRDQTLALHGKYIYRYIVADGETKAAREIRESLELTA